MFNKLIAATAITLFAAQAHSTAMTAVGNIHFAAYSATPPGATATITLDEAQTTATVSFNPVVNNTRVSYATGIFDEVYDNLATFLPFNVGENADLIGSVLWQEESGYSLTVETIAESMVTTSPSGEFLEITANGRATIAKGDVSIDGLWSISMDTSDVPVTTQGIRTFSDVEFAFSSTGTAFAEVPEPASLALIGLGLVGLGVSRRRQSA